MSINALVVLFPLVPFFCFFFALTVKYLVKKDISKILLYINAFGQMFLGIFLVYTFRNYEGIFSFSLTQWDYSIVFHIDAWKSYFFIAYLVPLIFSPFFISQIKTFNLRLIYLLYLGGCSGLIVTGDIFNFFVLYELMIMAAYVLIGIHQNYYASIKYMIFGAISSAIFLAGIVLLYASGAYFTFTFVDVIKEYNPYNIKFAFLLFSLAFFIKGAFFPVSSWVATCHSATNSLMSAFLSSFTIFTGILGLFYFVIQPAMLIDFSSIFDFLRIFSVLTLIFPAIFLFFEPDLKRCIAGSTVYSMGFIGLLLSYQQFILAFTYIIIHAVYKSALFLVYENIKVTRNLEIHMCLKSALIYIISILFTVGFFPTLIYFVKYDLLEDFILIKIIAYISMLLVMGSFFKFRIRLKPYRVNRYFFSLFWILIVFTYLIFPEKYAGIKADFVFDILLLAFAVTSSRRFFLQFRKLASLDRRYVFVNLNHEILYILLLFITQSIILKLFVFS